MRESGRQAGRQKIWLISSPCLLPLHCNKETEKIGIPRQSACLNPHCRARVEEHASASLRRNKGRVRESVTRKRQHAGRVEREQSTVKSEITRHHQIVKGDRQGYKYMQVQALQQGTWMEHPKGETG